MPFSVHTRLSETTGFHWNASWKIRRYGSVGASHTWPLKIRLQVAIRILERENECLKTKHADTVSILQQRDEALAAANEAIAAKDARILELTTQSAGSKRLSYLDECRKKLSEQKDTALRVTTHLVREGEAIMIRLQRQLDESRTKATELERQLGESRAKATELEKKLAEKPQINTQLMGLQIIESYAHKSIDLEKRLRVSTDKAAQLSIENHRLAESNQNMNRLMDRLIPLGEGSGTAIVGMFTTLTDLEQTFRQIKALTMRAAAVYKSRNSKPFLSFREDKLAYDLSIMTAKYNRAMLQNSVATESDRPPAKRQATTIPSDQKLKAALDEVRKLKADLACASRLRDQAESKVSAYEDLMLNHGITHKEMAGVLDCCVRADKLMAPLSKRTNGVSLDAALTASSTSFQYWKL